MTIDFATFVIVLILQTLEDTRGGAPLLTSERPVTYSEVYSTLYHNLGIDPKLTTIDDHNGRPQYLLEEDAPPLRELV